MKGNVGRTLPPVVNVTIVIGVGTMPEIAQKKEDVRIHEGDITVEEDIEVDQKVIIIEEGIPVQEVLDLEVIGKEVIGDIEDIEVKVVVVGEKVEIVAFQEEAGKVKEAEI